MGENTRLTFKLQKLSEMEAERDCLVEILENLRKSNDALKNRVQDLTIKLALE